MLIQIVTAQSHTESGSATCSESIQGLSLLRPHMFMVWVTVDDDDDDDGGGGGDDDI